MEKHLETQFWCNNCARKFQRQFPERIRGEFRGPIKGKVSCVSNHSETMRVTVVSCLMFVALFAVSFASDCSFIEFTSRENLEHPAASLVYDQFSYVDSSCGNNCTKTEAFSCVNFLDREGMVPCESMKYPKCMGRVIVYNECETLECCEELNKQVLPHAIPIADYTSFNYYMKFYDEFNRELTCDQFTSFSDDRCLQYVDYAASSDPETCYDLIDLFDSSDAMAFELF